MTWVIFPFFLFFCRCAIQPLWSEDYRTVTDHSQDIFQQAGFPWRCAYPSLSSGCQRSGVRDLENHPLPWSSKWVHDSKVCWFVQADLKYIPVWLAFYFPSTCTFFLLIWLGWEDISTALFFLRRTLIKSWKDCILNKDGQVLQNHRSSILEGKKKYSKFPWW